MLNSNIEPLQPLCEFLGEGNRRTPLNLAPSRRFAYFPQVIFIDSISLAMSSLPRFFTR